MRFNPHVIDSNVTVLDIPTLALWWRGDDYVVGTGTSPTRFSGITFSAASGTVTPGTATIKGKTVPDFDGTNDALVGSGNLDLSGTDKVTIGCVFNPDGVSGTQALFELTASAFANAGGLLSPFIGGAKANGAHNQAASALNTRAGLTTLVATGTTYVFTAQHDRAAAAGSEINLRINGVDDNGSATGSNSTGNFANAVPYIGSRAGTSLPYNGKLCELIVCASIISAEWLAWMESYLASEWQ